jgi:hypothetical protein
MRNRIEKKERIPIQTLSIKESKNDYRVFVWNHGTPKIVHFDSQEALKEGIRLAKKEGKKVLVVQVLFKIESE